MLDGPVAPSGDVPDSGAGDVAKLRWALQSFFLILFSDTDLDPAELRKKSDPDPTLI